MLSTATHASITDVTRSVLQQIGGNAILDQVIEVQGFHQLMLLTAEDQEEHAPQLATALRRLLRIIEQHGKPKLAESLKDLMAAIDLERRLTRSEAA